MRFKVAECKNRPIERMPSKSPTPTTKYDSKVCFNALKITPKIRNKTCQQNSREKSFVVKQDKNFLAAFWRCFGSSFGRGFGGMVWVKFWGKFWVKSWARFWARNRHASPQRRNQTHAH